MFKTSIYKPNNYIASLTFYQQVNYFNVQTRYFISLKSQNTRKDMIIFIFIVIHVNYFIITFDNK